MFEQPPLFTIVTVTRNNLAGLRLTAKSITQQLYKNYEWRVIDGASIDGTVDWLNQCNARGMIALSEPDDGLYHAMNKAIDKSRGKYVIFLNSGDEFANNKVLAKTANTISHHPAEVLYGDSFEISDGERLLKTAFPHHRIWYSMFTHHQAIFYSLEAIGETRYRDNLQIAGDWALTAELYKAGKSFHSLKYPVCVFERGGVSQSKDPNIIAKMYAERDWINQNIFEMSPLKSRAILYVKHSVERIRNKYPDLYDRLRFKKG